MTLDRIGSLVDIPQVSGHVCPMRALLAGTSGVDTGVVVSNLIDRLVSHGDISDATAADPRDVLVANVEDTIAERSDDLASVLASFRPRYQLAAWQRAGLAIAERLESVDPRHSLITTHLTYYTSGRQFSIIDLPTIRRWRPTASSRWWTTCWISTPRCSGAMPNATPTFGCGCGKSSPGAPPKSPWPTCWRVISTKCGPFPITWWVLNTPPRCCTG